MRLLNQALYVASAAYFLFPFFGNPWALAAISFLLGLGIGTGQPLSMTLIYSPVPGALCRERRVFSVPVLRQSVGAGGDLVSTGPGYRHRPAAVDDAHLQSCTRRFMSRAPRIFCSRSSAIRGRWRRSRFYWAWVSAPASRCR